jgi:RNA polymerase sigma factor (sigma-70 family)
VSETLLKPDVGDAELITAVRGGDVSAYGTLFERHVDAARRLARQLTTPSDADDLVSDAFAKVLRVLQNGGGPDIAFRAYLLTAVRRLHVDKIRAGAKLQTTDDLEKFDPGVPFRDTAVEGFENSAAAAAFASLPERWQLVLWHTEVEGQKPAEVAELLGMSANSVSALAYRAREGLRQAFLNSHIGDLEDAECRWTHDHLGPYIRNGVSKRDGHKVAEHLDGCRKCMAIYLELTEVNSNLSGILAPIILGAAATGYLASGGAAAVKAGFLVAAAGRVRDGVTANVPLSAAIGVAAVSTVVGVSVAVSLNQGDRVNVADDPPAVTSPSTPGATDPTAPEGTDPTRRTRANDDPSDVPATTPTDAATDPATAAAGQPTDTTTDTPTDTTTDGGTDPGASDNPGGGSDGPSGGTDGPGTDGPGTDGPGTGGHPPVPQSEFDYTVPRGQQQTTILVSELVQDEDGDELRFVRAALADPHGTLTITSVPVPARGASAAARTEQALVYVPERGWGGRDLVHYRVTDGEHEVDGSFRIQTVNDAPDVHGEDVSTPYGEPTTVDLLENDTDPDGDRLTLDITKPPTHGTLTRATGLARLFAAAADEGVVTYTPDAGWSGPDTVTYVVDDGHHQEQATLTVTTGNAPPPNNAPRAVDDNAVTGAGQPVTVDVLANDTDPDGDPLTLVSTSGAAHGTAEMVAGKVVYTPDPGWAGVDTVTYRVSDGDRTAPATLKVTTTAAPPANHAPVTQPDFADTGAGQAVTVDVLANDTDPDGDPLTLDSADGAAHGTAEVVAGKVVYTPDAGWAGVDTVTYVVSDGTDTATGTLQVSTTAAPPDNQAPVTQADFADTGAGQPVTDVVLAHDRTPDTLDDIL